MTRREGKEERNNEREMEREERESKGMKVLKQRPRDP